MNRMVEVRRESRTEPWSFNIHKRDRRGKTRKGGKTRAGPISEGVRKLTGSGDLGFKLHISRRKKNYLCQIVIGKVNM